MFLLKSSVDQNVNILVDIAREDDGRRIMMQRAPHDFAQMDACTVYGAAKQLFQCDHTVAVVEKLGREDLEGVFTELHRQIAAHFGRI